IPKSILHALPRDARPTVMALSDGRWIGATAHALAIHPSDATSSAWQFSPWSNYRAARWDGPTRILELTPIDGDAPPVRFELAGDDAYVLTTAIRERLEASIAHSVTRELPGGFVQVLIRRHGSQLISQTIVQGPPALATTHAHEIRGVEACAREAVGMSA
ncbi:MAG: hypothetical protein Q4Q03_07805, partial [Bowdeniella nasicola]|nr:hypothetical protein [Bowdeniella nasicola]